MKGTKTIFVKIFDGKFWGPCVLANVAFALIVGLDSEKLFQKKRIRKIDSRFYFSEFELIF